MSLREKENIITFYLKNIKKSILSAKPIDLFLIIFVFILIATPLVLNFFNRKSAEDTSHLNIIYLSPGCEDLFGKEMTEMLLQEFNEKNGDLRVELLDMTAVADDGEEAIQPDIFVFDDTEYGSLVSSGLLAVLEDEKLAITLVSFMDLFFYNIDILTEAGFDRPPKTRDEFIAYTKAVSGENVSGAVISLNPDDRRVLSREFFSWIWAAGGNFWSDEEGPVINTRAMISDISFLGSFYRDTILPLQESSRQEAELVFNMTVDQHLEEFADGRLAMMIASSRAISLLREKMGDETFGITYIPVPLTAGKYNLTLSGIFAGISASTEYPEEARRFLSFLEEKHAVFCEYFQAVPGSVSDNIPGEYIRNDPFYSKAQDIFEASAVVQGFSAIAGGDEYENIFKEEILGYFEKIAENEAITQARARMTDQRLAQDAASAIQNRWDEYERPD